MWHLSPLSTLSPLFIFSVRVSPPRASFAERLRSLRANAGLWHFFTRMRHVSSSCSSLICKVILFSLFEESWELQKVFKSKANGTCMNASGRDSKRKHAMSVPQLWMFSLLFWAIRRKNMSSRQKVINFNLWGAELMKCRTSECTQTSFFWEAEGKTLHIANELSKLYQMESCIVSRNNTGIRINISFLSASTSERECVLSRSLLRYFPKLKAIVLLRSSVCLRKFLPSRFKPRERKLFESNKREEKKTSISKQKFGIKCEKHIIWLIAQHLSMEADDSVRYIKKIRDSSSALRLCSEKNENLEC